MFQGDVFDRIPYYSNVVKVDRFVVLGTEYDIFDLVAFFEFSFYT